MRRRRLQKEQQQARDYNDNASMRYSDTIEIEYNFSIELSRRM